MIPPPRGMLDSAGDFFYKPVSRTGGASFGPPRVSPGPGGHRGGIPPVTVCGGRPLGPRDAQVAQLVEQRTENPRVGGSIPPLGTTTPTLRVRVCSPGDR